MTDLLLMQSIGASPDKYERYLALSEPIHRQYARACGADYEFFVGNKEGAHSAWNRIPMFRDAFANGYRKVVWLDADTLVVDQSVSIFAETDDTVALQMIRILDAHVEMPWPEKGWDPYNDGVLVANNCPEAIKAFDFVWANRRTPLKAYHHAGLWELNWLLDFVFENRDAVKLLDARFNWMAFAELLHLEPLAVIKAWHGLRHQERWDAFSATYHEVYG